MPRSHYIRSRGGTAAAATEYLVRRSKARPFSSSGGSVRCCDTARCIIIFPTTFVTRSTRTADPRPRPRPRPHEPSLLAPQTIHRQSNWISHLNTRSLAGSFCGRHSSPIGRTPPPAPNSTIRMRCKRRTPWRHRYGSCTARRKPSCPTRSAWRT